MSTMRPWCYLTNQPTDAAIWSRHLVNEPSVNTTGLRSLSALRTCYHKNRDHDRDSNCVWESSDFHAFPCPTKRKNLVDVWFRVANMRGRRGSSSLKWTLFLRKPNLFERGAGTSHGLSDNTHMNTPWDELKNGRGTEKDDIGLLLFERFTLDRSWPCSCCRLMPHLG